MAVPTFRAFFPLPSHFRSFFPSRGVFSLNCGLGSRLWTTQIVRLGFSGVILCGTLVVDAPVVQVLFHAVFCSTSAHCQILQNFVLMPAGAVPAVVTSLSYAATRCLATVKVPQIQFMAGVSGPFCRHRDMYAQLHLCMVGMLAAMRGSLPQFCSIFRPPSIWTLRPRVAGTPGV